MRHLFYIDIESCTVSGLNLFTVDVAGGGERVSALVRVLSTEWEILVSTFNPNDVNWVVFSHKLKSNKDFRDWNGKWKVNIRELEIIAIVVVKLSNY